MPSSAKLIGSCACRRRGCPADTGGNTFADLLPDTASRGCYRARTAAASSCASRSTDRLIWVVTSNGPVIRPQLAIHSERYCRDSDVVRTEQNERTPPSPNPERTRDCHPDSQQRPRFRVVLARCRQPHGTRSRSILRSQDQWNERVLLNGTHDPSTWIGSLLCAGLFHQARRAGLVWGKAPCYGTVSLQGVIEVSHRTS